MKDYLLEEAAQLIQWADQNISGPSKLNDELESWLKIYTKFKEKQTCLN